MLLHKLNGGHQAELKCAIMASVKPAGGTHVPLPGRDVQLGHLTGDQIDAFCYELTEYCEARPMFHSRNAARLHRLIGELESDYYLSVLIVDKGGSAYIHASGLLGAFDGILEDRNEMTEAISRIDIDLAAL